VFTLQPPGAGGGAIQTRMTNYTPVLETQKKSYIYLTPFLGETQRVKGVLVTTINPSQSTSMPQHGRLCDKQTK
jgi:hypothetical protein